MYRRAGFQPSPAIDEDGFLELIAGRVYMDVTRSPQMFCQDFPFDYDLQKLLSDPEASQKPPSVPRGSFSTRLKASSFSPRPASTIKSLAESADTDFRQKTVPEIEAWVARSRKQNLSSLSAEDLIARLAGARKTSAGRIRSGDAAAEPDLRHGVGRPRILPARKFLGRTCGCPVAAYCRRREARLHRDCERGTIRSRRRQAKSGCVAGRARAPGVG